MVLRNKWSEDPGIAIGESCIFLFKSCAMSIRTGHKGAKLTGPEVTPGVKQSQQIGQIDQAAQLPENAARTVLPAVRSAVVAFLESLDGAPFLVLADRSQLTRATAVQVKSCIFLPELFAEEPAPNSKLSLLGLEQHAGQLVGYAELSKGNFHYEIRNALVEATAQAIARDIHSSAVSLKSGEESVACFVREAAEELVPYRHIATFSVYDAKRPTQKSEDDLPSKVRMRVENPDPGMLLEGYLALRKIGLNNSRISVFSGINSEQVNFKSAAIEPSGLAFLEERPNFKDPEQVHKIAINAQRLVGGSKVLYVPSTGEHLILPSTIEDLASKASEIALRARNVPSAIEMRKKAANRLLSRLDALLDSKVKHHGLSREIEFLDGKLESIKPGDSKGAVAFKRFQYQAPADRKLLDKRFESLRAARDKVAEGHLSIAEDLLHGLARELKERLPATLHRIVIEDENCALDVAAISSGFNVIDPDNIPDLSGLADLPAGLVAKRSKGSDDEPWQPGFKTERRNLPLDQDGVFIDSGVRVAQGAFEKTILFLPNSAQVERSVVVEQLKSAPDASSIIVSQAPLRLNRGDPDPKLADLIPEHRHVLVVKTAYEDQSKPSPVTIWRRSELSEADLRSHLQKRRRDPELGTMWAMGYRAFVANRVPIVRALGGNPPDIKFVGVKEREDRPELTDWLVREFVDGAAINHINPFILAKRKAEALPFMKALGRHAALSLIVGRDRFGGDEVLTRRGRELAIRFSDCTGAFTYEQLVDPALGRGLELTEMVDQVADIGVHVAFFLAGVRAQLGEPAFVGLKQEFKAAFDKKCQEVRTKNLISREFLNSITDAREAYRSLSESNPEFGKFLKDEPALCLPECAALAIDRFKRADIFEVLQELDREIKRADRVYRNLTDSILDPQQQFAILDEGRYLLASIDDVKAISYLDHIAAIFASAVSASGNLDQLVSDHIPLSAMDRVNYLRSLRAVVWAKKRGIEPAELKTIYTQIARTDRKSSRVSDDSSASLSLAQISEDISNDLSEHLAKSYPQLQLRDELLRGYVATAVRLGITNPFSTIVRDRY